MNTAIILTGALRTIKKTISYVKSMLCYGNVHIFACVQNDTLQSEEDWNNWFVEQIETISIIWFNSDKYPGWIEQRNILLDNIHIENIWKEYLRTSGSMIEYYQLQLAYLNMCSYEKTNNIKYDYIIKTRTDSIFMKPVDFHWLNWMENEISLRMEKIQNEMPNVDVDVLFTYFMCTIISDDIIPNMNQIMANYTSSPIDCSRQWNPLYIKKYIEEGRYILTIRKNNLYIVNRDYFYVIPSLGTMYGQFKYPYSDEYWFNAEGQFRGMCYYSCISVYDYSSIFEETSLEYEHLWNGALYFDEEGKPLHNTMLYCVVRK